MAASYAVVTGTLPYVVSNYTDFTASGFGTPTAAILFAGSARVENNPMINARMSIGFWDGTNQRTCGIVDLDNKASAETSRCSDDSYGMVIPWSGGSGAGGTESWFTISNITDGIRVTLSVEDLDTSTSVYVTVILLAGINAKVLTFTPNATQNATQASASLGFAPQLLLFASIGATTADVACSIVTSSLSFGFAEIKGAHRNIRFTGVSAAADMDYRLKFDEDRCCGQENVWAMDITTWDSDTFTATTRDGASGDDVTFCLALGGADLRYDVGTLTTRTSTGDTVIATTNIPDTALLMLSTATSTTRHTDSGANGIMIGAGKGTSEYAHSISIEDGAATSNSNGVYQSAQILDLDSSASGSRTDLCDATAVFNPSDMTLTYSAVDATARKGWYLIFGQSNILRKMYHYLNQ